MTRDMVGYAWRYPAIEWPDQVPLALSLCVHYQEGAELSPLEGDAGPESAVGGNPVEGEARDLFGESLFEYGARRGLWRILETLDAHGIKATFFCAGQAIERNPAGAKAIAAAQHEVAGHGYRWIPYNALDEDDERQDIERAVRAITEAVGERPVGWNSRTPSPNTRRLLGQVGGFLYESDSYGDDLPYRTGDDGRALPLAVPYTLEVTDSKFWAIPLVAGYSRPSDFGAVMREAFDRLLQEGQTQGPRMMSIGLHLRISGQPAFISEVDDFLSYARRSGAVWVARRRDIAQWWIDHTETD